MSSPPPAKRQKQSPSTDATKTTTENASTTVQQSIAPKTPLDIAPPPPPATTTSQASQASPMSISPTSPTMRNPRKRPASPRSPKLNLVPPGTQSSQATPPSSSMSIPALIAEDSTGKKRGRTNTPWTAVEEQRLKQMRDAGNSWGDIAKAFPNRTEGSVKKHWYKDMHYAEFAEDESIALREAIREYEANKWKAIGAKLGKPAKACEQYAREHFKNP